MSSVYLKTRLATTKHPRTGRYERYYVYYRRGGRGFPEEYAGGFATKKEQLVRRDFIAGEIAAGRDPKLILDALRTPPAPKPGIDEAWDTWATSKRKVGRSAQALYRNSKAWWIPILGADTDPETVTVIGVTAGLDEMLEDLAPSTVRLYLSHLAMMLDFALPDGTPNPARSRKIELPETIERERMVPTNSEWAAITANVAARSRLALRVMECGAFRVSEACAIEPGDVDIAGGQILIRRTVTKTRAGRRWVPNPAELLAGLVERGGVGVSPTQVYYDLQQACKKAKIREFGTHAFRRRRISLWYAQQVDGPQVARWSGHSKASESMDTYAFEVVDALADEWLSFWQGIYGRRGAAPVRHEDGVRE